jgi:hypothetical protein
MHEVAQGPRFVNGATTWRYYGGIGSRETPTDVLLEMTVVARWQRGRKRVLRSGAARGADDAFELGAGYLSEIWVPWRKFPFREQSDADPYYSVIPDGEWHAELQRQAMRFHPAWSSLTQGGRSLMVRNMAQLLGGGPYEPASEYMIGYATCDCRGEWAGGTGQAFRGAKAHNIPVINFWTPRGPLGATDVIEQILMIEAA